MNTPELLSKLNKSTSRIARALRRFVELIFGNISWRPPGWLSRSVDGCSRFGRAHPRLIASGVIAILLISCGGAWTWKWYSHLPKPRKVSAKIVPVEVTKLEKELKFPRLVVYFSESAARLEDLKKPSVQGVRLEPHLDGAWHWAQADILVFEPSEDWPADQKFRVIFDKNFFPRHVSMERLAYETRTPPFSITVKELEIYQDPTNPTRREISATLELTHAVDPGELERHVQLTMVGGSNIFPPNDPAPHFTTSYGLHRRIAYIHSSQIVLPEHEDFLNLTVTKGLRTAQGGAQTRDAIEQKLRIPSVASMFQIDSIQTTVARNKNGEPEQLIVLTTTADISTRELSKALQIRLLPKRKLSDAEKAAEVETEGDLDETSDESAASNEETDSDDDSVGSQVKETELWKSATDVPDDVLDAARPVAFAPMESEKPLGRQHAFRVRVESDGELYVRVNKGVRAFGGFPLSEDYNAVVAVPALPREVQIEGQGGSACAQWRTKAVDPLPRTQRNRIRDCACRHDADQSSGQPNRGKIRASAFSRLRTLQRGEHFPHRARATGHRAREQMESKLLGIRLFRASAQAGRRRQRARSVFRDCARLGFREEKSDQSGQRLTFHPRHRHRDPDEEKR